MWRFSLAPRSHPSDSTYLSNCLLDVDVAEGQVMHEFTEDQNVRTEWSIRRDPARRRRATQRDGGDPAENMLDLLQCEYARELSRSGLRKPEQS